MISLVFFLFLKTNNYLQMKKTIFLFISLFSVMIYAQKADYSSFFKAGTKFNVTDLDRFINEVYADKSAEMMQTVRYEDYKDLLTHRMVVALIPSGKIGNIQSTNDMRLNNDYVTLTYDKGYDAGSFNPFKYDLDFFPNNSVSYQIGNSDYILIIISH